MGYVTHSEPGFSYNFSLALALFSFNQICNISNKIKHDLPYISLSLLCRPVLPVNSTSTMVTNFKNLINLVLIIVISGA
jgi:hypothetical protein